MPRSKTDFDVVQEIGLDLPDVEDGSSYRGRALKLRGRLLACQATHKSAEPNSLVVRVSFDERERLLEADPDIYYVTDHYLKYPSVLVRLDRIGRKALRELLHGAWRFVMERA
jgi:hypothetical protein